ncbi:MAG: OsmC family protein [Candidatus Marinimicrobia bacterium]|jgi:putative redox protein|nr:OsmC family protein [Candidatus Neomarinimicrobiota bacterium]MBT4752425.1 OsmC family protein [Candidatus Neomarinimicrobiota bacterium]MBT7946205.1 OsmC family protein [Candidatus Neomarinimicrobiota bacterium]
MISKVVYKGDLRTEAFHLQSGETIITDAPVDNEGKGEAFSPTDLLATALASCMLTIMGIVAKRDGIDMEGATAEVEKIMASNPRRIGEIRLKINFVHPITDKDQAKLERAAHTCPVSKSLHTDLTESIEFIYPNP